MAYPYPNSNDDLMIWISVYIPLFYVGVITYPRPYPDAGLTNSCW